MRALPRVRETRVQAAIVQLIRSVNGKVYVIGRPPRADAVHKGTGQTPGIPDLVVHLPEAPGPSAWLAAGGYGGQYPPHELWIEVKGQGGRLSEAQKGFADFCRMAGVPHIVGGVDEVAAYLTHRGYLRG